MPPRDRKRPAGMRQWLERRGFRADRVDTTVLLGGVVALRVLPQGQLPGNVGPSTILDQVQVRFPQYVPAFVRVTDRDPGRCQMVVRMDDALPMLEALIEMRLDRAARD